MERYTSVGALIRDCRKYLEQGQETFAESIGVDVRSLGRWERGEHVPDEENLLRLSRATLLAFEALLRLSHGFETHYNLRTHRFAYSPYERDFVSRRVVQTQLFDAPEDERIAEIDDADALPHILGHKRRVYAADRRATDSAIADAVRLARPLNWIARGAKGDYVGHVVAFPLGPAGIAGLSDRAMREGQLSAPHFVPLTSRRLAAIHMYSFYACNSGVAYALLRRFVRSLLIQWPHLAAVDCVLSRYAVTADGVDLASEMGLALQYEDVDEWRRARTEVTPQFRASPLASLTWLDGYRRKLRMHE